MISRRPNRRASSEKAPGPRRKIALAMVTTKTLASRDVEIQRALAAGARGYVLKSIPPRELVEAIRQVHAGKKRVPSEVAAHLVEHLGEKS